MNLVANSCIGGYLYRLHNEAFGNPFMWAMLQSDAMTQCINKFNYVNWGHIKMEPDVSNPLTNRCTYNVIVDDSFTIHYTHYLRDEKYPRPTRIGVDVHGEKIENYIVEKYLSRCKRMCSARTNPVFCILCAEFLRYDFSLDNTRRVLIETENSPYHKILITNHEELLDFQSKTTHIFVDEHPVNQGKYNTKWFATEYYDKIMDIVSQSP